MPRPTKPLECSSPPSCEPGAVLVETPRLVLRRFAPSDAAALARAANHRAVWENLRDSFPTPYTLADAESFLTPRPRAAGSDPAKDLYPTKLAVCLKSSGGDEEAASEEPRLLGSIGMSPGEDVMYRTWELGYWFAPDAWGRGSATEATAALVRWTLRTWPGVRRVHALTFGGNPQSGKVLEKCGFTLEGVQREAAEKCGVLQDLCVYALLRSDVDLDEAS